ncbi:MULTISPECIES: hypothetical protein [unclassified Halanaerobium]|uniref:hypothetical protein n=1 Tax=unclassified Halanaerobium TaxID=2641197 RepID=UPI000DF152EE|nr:MULTISPECIES: hypothetical protein [unclassified Halanaerobium]RCW40870.1 hypothetical protein DFR78_1413 [Halanaerobium sp. MA284_MarDTE_T2]RCW79071.1 hypothetical protein DER71_1423 [Halanaerobium sp. DL-01]
MEPYVMASDLYKFKLALILGRGKRLKRVMRRYPTEKKFKAAPRSDLAKLIGVQRQSELIEQLFSLDSVYNEMVTFQPSPFWSKKPDAELVMAVDTEYYKSKLDMIQYIIMKKNSIKKAGIIFTNKKLAPSVSPEEGVDILRTIINKYKPEVIVGHNFNSDISILETAAARRIPEIYHYDDTMDLMYYSNLANIIGGAGLNKAAARMFSHNAPDLDTAYSDLSILAGYGIKDALFTLLIRHFIMYGEFQAKEFNFKIDNIIKEENREILNLDKVKFSFEDERSY